MVPKPMKILHPHLPMSVFRSVCRALSLVENLNFFILEILNLNNKVDKKKSVRMRQISTIVYNSSSHTLKNVYI